MREQRKILVGRVLSNRMEKTVVVEVRQRKRHRLYGKVINTRKRFKAHDADNACQIGDLVKLIEFRPLSREKRWLVTDILESVGEASGPRSERSESRRSPSGDRSASGAGRPSEPRAERVPSGQQSRRRPGGVRRAK